MKVRILALGCALLLLLLVPASTLAAAPVQRFLLVVGANAGGSDRPKLQYALSDAERFARVMVDLGGVPAANEVILRQPRLRELIDALDALSARAAEARRAPGAGRVEVIVYYSGHADEQGLLIGADRYSYRTLRDRLDQIPADVRIAVLDACASGAFIRLKGGKARPAFLVDESADMRGHAYLTSSAETESAQESDRIRASYFTHYLISGFRGAADLSGDGKVTLSEAYQFALSETLGKTVDTRGGAQHPSYDINLSGSGDVIMTDVRQTTATLVLGEELDGRFFIRTPAQELVVELYKPFGRRIELGLEPGGYEVRLDRDKTSMLAKTKIDEGAKVTLEPKQFGAVAREATRKRGFDPARGYVDTGRYRVEVLLGMWRSGPQVVTGVGGNGSAGVYLTRFVADRWAVSFGASAAGATGVSTSSLGTFSGTSSVVLMPITVRWNPVRPRLGAGIRPYVMFGAGPVFGSSVGSFTSRSGGSISGVHHDGTAGGPLGAGMDVHVSRLLTVGVSGGYNWVVPFSQPVGARKNYSGPQVGFTIGILFGRETR